MIHLQQVFIILKKNFLVIDENASLLYDHEFLEPLDFFENTTQEGRATIFSIFTSSGI